jgi:hypothetical protein
MRKTIFLILLLTLITAFLPSPVYASSKQDDKVVLGGSFTLDGEDSLYGTLIVIGGTAYLDEGSTVTGDVVILGGTLTAKGKIMGNSFLMGSSAVLTESSGISGNLITISSHIDQEKGSVVDGNVQELFSGKSTSLFQGQNILPGVNPEVPALVTQPLMEASKVGLQSFIAAIFAMLLALLFPGLIIRTQKPIFSAPVSSAGFGLLTTIIAPFVLVLVTITIIGIPITLILAFALAFAVFIGWAAIGSEIGTRIAKAFNSQWHLALQAGVGTLILSLVLEVVGRIPCIGWVFPFLISLVGLGAAVLTRLGTREYIEN